MTVPIDLVRADFDRIGALMSGAALDRTNRLALSCVRPMSRSILEVGCGIGSLSEHLATRTERLVAIDPSRVMSRLTAKRCPRAEVIQADVLTWRPCERFETVIAVAMLHHVALDEGLAKLASLVAPGGQLVIVDLFAAGFAYSAINAVLQMFRSERHGGPELAAAWAAHGRHEQLPRLREVRAACLRVVPQAQIRRHLGWRYSIVATM